MDERRQLNRDGPEYLSLSKEITKRCTAEKERGVRKLNSLTLDITVEKYMQKSN